MTNPPSAQVSFTLEGCRNNGSIVLPNGGGKFICPDGAYTTGNLGKGWNELDLVPHRLTTSAGNQAGATTKYSVIIAADYRLGTKIGYDVVSIPEINAAKSDASCKIEAGAQLTISNVTGGVDDVIYRYVNIEQNKGTACVLDYYQRLALGAAQYSGSSLQSYMFEKSDFSTGKRTISIPVKEILPQQLRKDMSAVQGSDSVWNVTKQATPATVLFPDTCDVNAPRSKPVGIRVTWTKRAPTPGGQITVTTNIYAKNPASRVVTVNVTDDIRSGLNVLHTISTPAGGVDVPANIEQLVLTHTFLVPEGTPNLNDVATATYTDKVTGVAVPGNTTASAPVQNTGPATNQTATVKDVEQISGAGLTFSADSFTFNPSGPIGAFAGYTAGTQTSSPVTWNSGTLSASGSVDFSKTVYVDAGGINTTGTLSDVATLTTAGGVTGSANASINISAGALVKLTINKTIPNVLQSGESQTFTFRVKDSNGTEVASRTLTFNAGETSKSVDVTGLQPGNYSVSEDGAAGWAAQSDQSATINLPACSGSVSFVNTVPPASANIRKVTLPAGAEAGWEMTLTGPGTPAGGEKVTTTGTGSVNFTTTLQEGSYTVTETPKPGFDQTNASIDCSFTVNYPADAGRMYDCVFTNTQRGSITIIKDAVPNDAQDFGFTTTGGGLSTFSLDDDSDGTLPNTRTFTNLVPGSYSVTEGATSGWALSGLTCTDPTSNTTTSAPTASINLGAGETVTCTFTNTRLPKLTVVKVVQNDFGGTKGVGDFMLKVNSTTVTSGVTNTYPVGNYTVSETMPLPYGYTQDSLVCKDNLTGATTNGGSVSLAAGDDKTCTITNSDSPATIIVIKNAKPANGSFAFTTNGTGYTPFTLSGDPTGGLNKNTQTNLSAGSYNVKEGTQLGWMLTGIGGSTDPNTPYACLVSGSGGSIGTGDLNTQTATINLKMGDTVTCVFENTGQGVTRTQGFWQTHPQLAEIAWFGGTRFRHTFPGVTMVNGIGNATLCTKSIDTLGKLMGGFWSGISNTSTRNKRSAVDQSRMQLLQQMLAAQLNASAFGSVPNGEMAMFAVWESAYCGTDMTAINQAQQQAAAFNTPGDSSAFTPGTSADSKTARSIAAYSFWDNTWNEPLTSDHWASHIWAAM